MSFSDIFKKNDVNGAGCPDVPVTKIKDDRFNVGPYINGLSSFILSCDTPMTISIQGDWGSGKTSMMNMIEANIKNSVYPIWFNTWQFSQFSLGNSLAISMMDVLLQRLIGDSGKLETVLKGVWGLAKNVALTATEITVGSRAAGKAEEAMGGTFSGSYVKEILALKEQFQKAVNEKLTETKRRRVVIFVDDLDRLHPAKAVELLEVLKLFLDCENCVFVLAVDYEVVTLGIKQKYGSDVDAQKGKSFFDKIIQLPFKMPVAQYDIKNYVRDMMERMKIAVTENNVNLFSSLIRTSIGLNPRSMKRLFNTYQLLDIITNGAVKNIPDNARQRILFATVCLQMSFDVLYNYLAAGNIDLETLKDLSKVTGGTVQNFTLRREMKNDNGDMENTGKNILDEIFDRDDFSPETMPLIQRLPKFLEFFLESLTENDGDDLTKTEVRYLQEIIQCSAVTSVNNEGPDDAATESLNNRRANRRLVVETNDVLKKFGLNEFVVYQSKNRVDGILESYASGYTFLKAKDHEYKLQYDVDNAGRFGISVNIALNDPTGYKKGRAEIFYQIFGENPLGYPDLRPEKDEWGWYYYDNMLTVTEGDPNAPNQIADLVRDAYTRLEKFLKKLNDRN